MSYMNTPPSECYPFLPSSYRCQFGRFWRVIPIELELGVHEIERLICSILPISS
jgi:hypothetical protein